MTTSDVRLTLIRAMADNGLSAGRIRIIEAGSRGPITTETLRLNFGMTLGSAKTLLRSSLDSGYIDRVGSDRSGVYKLSDYGKQVAACILNVTPQKWQKTN